MKKSVKIASTVVGLLLFGGAAATAQPEDNHGAAVSDLARSIEAEGKEKGQAIAALASDGRSTERGRSGENDGAGGTPNGGGGNDTADEASGGMSGGVAEDHRADQAGGGSANADGHRP